MGWSGDMTVVIVVNEKKTVKLIVSVYNVTFIINQLLTWYPHCGGTGSYDENPPLNVDAEGTESRSLLGLRKVNSPEDLPTRWPFNLRRTNWLPPLPLVMIEVIFFSGWR